ncbi:MAG TPA: VacJ family lipoprotein [Geobacteraceae bacterium]
MAGIRSIGILLVAVVIFACPVRAEVGTGKAAIVTEAGRTTSGQAIAAADLSSSGEAMAASMDEGADGGNIAPGAGTPPAAGGAPVEVAPEDETIPEKEIPEEAIQEVSIPDPIEPWNRMMYQFNDKLYFWVMKPVCKGYNKVVPEPARVSVNNFFRNAAMPVRFVNSLLQGKFKTAGSELARFGINTTIGIAGFVDVARDRFDIEEHKEDLGQTLGIYGMPGMMYIVWPFLGPSTVRDSVGFAGDSFLAPASYLEPFYVPMSLDVYSRINNTSLDLSSYEDLKKSSIEPYAALRDAYIQYRQGLIRK